MPVSDINNIPPILHRVVKNNPKTVLELGIGFGKYGCLVREVLDAVHGRTRVHDSEVTLIGVEGYPVYNNPNWGHYNAVLTEDFGNREKWNTYAGFDLVLAIDSIEHLDKDTGLELIKHLVTHNKEVIVSVPLGHWPQGPVFGNTYEVHRADWLQEDFILLAIEEKFSMQQLHIGVCGVFSLKQ